MARRPTHPYYENDSGWNALLPCRTANCTRPDNDSPAFIVIGAGYTGLAAARRLAELEPRKQVLLLEATVIGEGASGRNSGFVVSAPGTGHLDGSREALDRAFKQARVLTSGLEWLKGLVDKYGIKCQWHDCPKIHAAATEAGEKALRNRFRQYREMGVEGREIPRDELGERIGTGYYAYAMQTEGNAFIQPAALVRGLADNLPDNVTICENTPVVSVEEQGSVHVHTRDGSFRAGKVIVANNGFAKALGYLRQQLVTIYTYAGITPALDDKMLAQHGIDPEWGVLPANRLGTTLRKISNDRFMVRSAYSYERPEPQYAVDALLTDCYKRRYPHLESHRFEYVWGGVTALTRNGAMSFGKVGENVFAAAGCNGGGVLQGSIYGKLLAEMALGSQSQTLSDVLSLEQPSWMPPEPVRRLIISTAIQWEKNKAGAER